MALGKDLMSKLGECKVGESKKVDVTVEMVSEGKFKVTAVGYEKPDSKPPMKKRKGRPAAVEAALDY